MDNLTHSLTGLLLSRAGLNRLHPHANWLMFFAANAPDCDAISVLGGAATYFQFHRWFTHSWLAIPIIAALPAIAVRILFWKSPFRWRTAYLMSLAGVLSHVLLDWTNPYGIRLYVPFSNRWSALHWTSVFDALIWAVLLVATLWPMLSRLVLSEIGARAAPVGRGWAIAALLFLPLYNTGRALFYQRAVEVQMGRTYSGEAARRAFAMPTHFNPLVWDGVVETSSTWVLQEVDLRKELDPAAAQVVYKAAATPAIEAARRAPLVAEFLRFSPTPQWTATPASDLAGGTRVEVRDLRFGFTVWAVVDGENEVRETGFRF